MQSFDYRNKGNVAAITPVEKGIDITPGTPFTQCKCISTDTAQRVVVTWPDGTTSHWDMVAGANPISITNVATGTSGNFTAGY